MSANTSRNMILFGIGVAIFYCLVLGTGNLSAEVMPPFIIAALIFLSSGRFMAKGSRAGSQDDDEAPPRPDGPEWDWPWMAALLNYFMVFVIISSMAIFLMMPAGLSLQTVIEHALDPEHFVTPAVP